MKKVFLIILLTLNILLASETKNIKLLVNSPLQFQKPLNTTKSKVGKSLIKAINNTNNSIDFAIYGIRNQDSVMKALIKAKKRGVKIRGIVDKDINNENYYTSTKKLISYFPNIQTDYAADLLTKTKQTKFNYVPYCDRPNKFNGPLQCVGYSLNKDECIIATHVSKEKIEFKGDIMHNKFFIFDEKLILTGSTNISDSGTGGYNANNTIIIYDKDIANVYKKEFEEMYVLGNYHRSKNHLRKSHFSKYIDRIKVDVSFSPQSYTVEKLIRPLIKNSKKYIDLPIFFLTHKKLTGDLIQAKQRGVKVRIIIDATAAKNGYSKHEILRAAGIPVKVENWGGKMHMKVAVIDGEHLITGSMNWTSAGEKNNDENTIIIHDKYYAHTMHTFFNTLWSSIDDKYLQAQPNPEGLTSYDSCFDGIDNDFDKVIDQDEKSCKDEKIYEFNLPPFKIVKKEAGNNLIKGNINYKDQYIYIYIFYQIVNITIKLKFQQ